MSFALDRKREHERGAIAAVRGSDFSQALFHAAQAAELGFQLAEQTTGHTSVQYTEDARGWVQMVRQIKEKAGKTAPVKAVSIKSSVQGGVGEEPAGGSQWQLKERPKDRLADVAGLVDVKEQLRQLVIDPFNKPEVYKRFKAGSGGGVLMYGPPGNGKTFIARAIAGELDSAFFLVDSSQIKDKYVGESEKKLTSLFKQAREAKRAVIFFDEVDDLLSSRGNQKIGTVTTFLKLADGFGKDDDGCLLILGATNKPWVMSPAVLRPGRLGTHIYVGPPDEPARAAILKYNFDGVPLEDVDLAAFAGQTDRYSGAELAAICERAKLSAIGRQLNTGNDESVTAADITAALKAAPPQTSDEQLKDFERFRYSQTRGARPANGDGGEED